MGAAGKENKQAGVDNKQSTNVSDRFARVTKPEHITPYEMGKLRPGDSLHSNYDSRNDPTHGKTNLIRDYKIVKGKGDSYTIYWRTTTQTATGGSQSYTSSVVVSKAGLSSYLERMVRGGDKFTFNYGGKTKEIKK